jgi:hypothetical protein
MQKTLIKLDNIDGAICRLDNRIYVDSTMVLSPGAKDELNKRGVTIIYGSCPSQASCPEHGHGKSDNSLSSCLTASKDLESLRLGMATMIKKECGVINPERLKALSLQAVETIRDNLS